MSDLRLSVMVGVALAVGSILAIIVIVMLGGSAYGLDLSRDACVPDSITATGENVVIGIVDTGIDLLHQDFRNTDGTTRIKWAYDESWVGTKPPGFTYGAEYSESQINSGAASSLKDYDGFGTHALGVAAGNGRATGNGQPSGVYVGIAPDADLLVCKTNWTQTGVIDGIKWCVMRAATLGKPCVILVRTNAVTNIAQVGPHDGSLQFERDVAAQTGVGKLIVTPAGDDGGLGIHKSVDLVSSLDSIRVTVHVAAYNPSTVTPEFFVADFWYPDWNRFRVAVESPSGWRSAWMDTADALTTTIAEGTVDIRNALSSSNDKPIRKLLASLNVYRNTTVSPHPAVGDWKFVIQRLPSSPGGTGDVWRSRWFLDTTVEPTILQPTPGRSIETPGNANGVLTIGDYVTRTSFTNRNGGTTSVPETLGTVTSTTGLGTRGDGATKPEAIGPGWVVLSSLSVNAPTSNSYKALDGVHYMRLVTGYAHAAGVLALLLEQEPTLTPDFARAHLVRLTGGIIPSTVNGWGKVVCGSVP